MIVSFSDKEIDFTRDRIDSFDICKPILCILIVMIHINPLPGYFWTLTTPFVRIGVPIFYLMSGFLFFRKYDRIADVSEQRLMFKKYIRRLLSMYLFWLLVFLGPTIEKRGWFSDGILQGLPDFVHSLLFGSTFIASWYLMASVLGMALVLFLGRRLSERSCTVIATCLYMSACIFSTHSYLSAVPGIGLVNSFWKTVHVNPCNSVPVGFFWLQVSRIINRRIDTWSNKLDRTGALPLMGIVAAFLLCLEQRFVRVLGFPMHDDCFFSLILLAPVLFLSILRLRITSPHTVAFRKWSSLTYAAHGPIGYILRQLSEYSGMEMLPAVRFLLTLTLCTLILLLFERLARHSHFAWLKVAY